MGPTATSAVLFAKGGFTVLLLHHPLAQGDEPFRWIDEVKRPPWSVYVGHFTCLAALPNMGEPLPDRGEKDWWSGYAWASRFNQKLRGE